MCYVNDTTHTVALEAFRKGQFKFFFYYYPEHPSLVGCS